MKSPRDQAEGEEEIVARPGQKQDGREEQGPRRGESLQDVARH